jgi:hypothetical protein
VERLDVTVEDQLEWGAPEHRRRSPRSWQLTVAAAVIVIGALAIYTAQHHHKGFAGRHVVYSVTSRDGARVVSINFATAGGSTELPPNTPIPWAYTLRPNEIPTKVPLYLAAQNDTTASGSTTCTITIDGTIAAKNTAQGAASVATCTALMN